VLVFQFGIELKQSQLLKSQLGHIIKSPIEELPIFDSLIKHYCVQGCILILIWTSSLVTLIALFHCFKELVVVFHVSIEF